MAGNRQKVTITIESSMRSSRKGARHTVTVRMVFDPAIENADHPASAAEALAARMLAAAVGTEDVTIESLREGGKKLKAAAKRKEPR
jgi:hypothetical protein